MAVKSESQENHPGYKIRKSGSGALNSICNMGSVLNSGSHQCNRRKSFVSPSYDTFLCCYLQWRFNLRTTTIIDELKLTTQFLESYPVSYGLAWSTSLTQNRFVVGFFWYPDSFRNLCVRIVVAPSTTWQSLISQFSLICWLIALGLDLNHISCENSIFCQVIRLARRASSARGSSVDSSFWYFASSFLCWVGWSQL